MSPGPKSIYALLGLALAGSAAACTIQYQVPAEPGEPELRENASPAQPGASSAPSAAASPGGVIVGTEEPPPEPSPTIASESVADAGTGAFLADAGGFPAAPAPSQSPSSAPAASTAAPPPSTTAPQPVPVPAPAPTTTSTASPPPAPTPTTTTTAPPPPVPTDAGTAQPVDAGATADSGGPSPTPSGVTCTVIERAPGGGCTEIVTTETPRFWFVNVNGNPFGGITTDSQGMKDLYLTSQTGFPYFQPWSSTIYVGYDQTAERVTLDAPASFNSPTATVSIDYGRMGEPPPGCTVPAVHVTCSGSTTIAP